MKWVQINGLFEVIVTRGSLRKLNLIALRSEEVVQHELNTMLNKKLAGMGQNKPRNGRWRVLEKCTTVSC